MLDWSSRACPHESYNLYTQDGDFDSQISVFEGGCGAWQCVGGNDDDDTDSCGTEAGVHFKSDKGKMYYILVFGYFDSGDFGFVVKKE